MPSRLTDAPFGIGAAHQVYVAGGGSDVRQILWGRTPAKNTFQKPFPLTGQRPPRGEEDIRLEERGKERARIVHELHDTLLQGFLGASMLLDQAVEQTPADSPNRPALDHALHMVRRAVDEGRAAIRGIHATVAADSSLEEALSRLLSEVAPGGNPRVRLFVQGTWRALNPAIQEQLFLIGREAVMNALRHSGATRIAVEVQYLHDVLRVLVRDDGCGISPEAVQKKSGSHWGLSGMRERAENIGARLDIWSRTGSGTEVRVAAPVDAAKRQTMIAVHETRGEGDDKRQLHPSLERRRPPAGPGGYRHSHQRSGRHVARWDGNER